MQGDGGQEVGGSEDFKFAVDFGVEPGVVDDWGLKVALRVAQPARGRLAVRMRVAAGLGERGRRRPGRGRGGGPLAGEGREVFVLAMVAANAGKATLQVAAVQELVDHLGNDGAQDTIARLNACSV